MRLVHTLCERNREMLEASQYTYLALKTSSAKFMQELIVTCNKTISHELALPWACD